MIPKNLWMDQIIKIKNFNEYNMDFYEMPEMYIKTCVNFIECFSHLLISYSKNLFFFTYIYIITFN